MPRRCVSGIKSSFPSSAWPNAPSVIFGRDKHLYERAYIDEYCGRRRRGECPVLADWAEKIRDIQDYADITWKGVLCT
jgi:hypothetical protein